jgi:predicted MFS family arabinose efflux permease
MSWHVLTYPGFRRYFFRSTLSNLGTWLQNTAQALLAYHLTHSALAVGVVVSAQFSPVLVFGPWAGGVATKVRSLSQLLIITQLLSAAIATALAGLYATGHLTVIWLAAGAFAVGLVYCFALPAFATLVPTLVPTSYTRAATAMNSVSYNVGRSVAPLAAVLIINTIGYGWVFTLNGVSFLVMAAGLPKVHRRPIRLRGIRTGFRMACRDRNIWRLLAMVAAVTIAADPVLVLGPAMARHLNAPSDWAGYFLAALGAGTVAGSFIPVRQPSRLRHAAYPILLLSAAIIAFALGLNLALCLAMAFVAGIACLLAGSVTQSLLLTLAGPERVAAVMAVWAVAWAGSKPLASLADGWLASHFGLHTAGIVLTLPALLLGLLVVLLP